MFGKRLLPQSIMKPVAPAVKFTPSFICIYQQPAEPSVSPGKNPFNNAYFRILPFKVNPGHSKLFLQPVQILPWFFQYELWGPLKRGMRLWNQCCHADIYISPVPFWSFYFAKLLYKSHDSLQIIIGFSGKTCHEIQLYGLPAKAERIRNSLEYLSFWNVFVDNIPEPLAAGLWRNSKTCFSNFFNKSHQLRG